MTKINVISGFLGAGKTTFIKRLIGEVFQGEKLVLIENEFGEIGVDGGFLQDAGIQITEMISGCICCSLVGDFTKALEETIKTYTPDRILIEPSGVGKLSDVIAAVERIGDGVSVDTCITVVDGTKCKLYRRNFAEFYVDQIQHANCILMTRTDKASEAKIEEAVKIIREINGEANIITTHLSLLSKEQIVEAFRENTMEATLLEETKKAHAHHHDHDEECECGCHEHHHEHHHHDHEEECECGCHEHHHEHHHHDHEEECECGCHKHHHEHHHHDHDEECECGCHEHHHEHHHHDHDEECTCGCHDHHHHHHHADEAFTSWGFETARKYTEEEIKQILTALDGEEYGSVLRAKGMVDGGDHWIYFDYVPGEPEVRTGAACIIGKICVIGAELHEGKLAELFGKAN
ncbi:MAG: GTP-binding protein [Clostridia bacterium]|nr:GTP-binding protein [Clostridia bacterium]